MNEPGFRVASKLRDTVLELLGERELAETAAVARAELVSVRTGQPVEQVLNQLGVLSDDDLVGLYAEVCACEIWEPARQRPVLAIEEVGVTVEFLQRNRLLPLRLDRNRLVCAACDPLDDEALSGLSFASGKGVVVLVARPADWRRVFDQVFSAGDAQPAQTDERRLEREIDQVVDIGGEGSGARLVAAVFEAAVVAGASDIHFEPRRHDLMIRLRIDGRLVEHRTAPADLTGPAVSRVKVIANLDLGERRLPQDGRTTFVVAGRQIDVRVATSPTVFGEAAVLRILDRASLNLDLEALGLNADSVSVLRQAARTAHGMFLVTGPTGSGKTTTLYALLQTFAGSAKKVLSVEDPVEYHFEHVVQTQVAPQIGLTFASALRSFLRQDPDVILVGEIRDPETAAVAVQAAMTGHLVLASIHANDAIAVIPRLQDMGVEPYQLAAGFRGAAAQRLVRRLCIACRQEREPSQAELHFATTAGAKLGRAFDAVGCPACKQSGFKGRTAISEGFQADESMLRAIADGKGAASADALVGSRRFIRMTQDGLRKAEAGETTVEEVMAVVNG
jgi:type II secretory ATPase GspE/PulE/Tfp pilus assembly ATPase PilB-like protein